MIHQPTIRQAMLTRMRFQRMMNEALVVRLEDRGDEVVMREELLTTGVRSLRQGYELVVGTGLQIWRAPLGPILNPLAVHFTHGPPADLSFHRAFLGPRIEFNSEFNGFTCRRADFDRPNPRADAALADYAERYILTLPYANDSSLANDVHGAIQVLLPVNGASVGAVASRMGLTERTLQRRLAEAGSDFTRLRNMIRRDHALRHLANARMSLAEVASLVGYSQETSFSRWFCEEFGVTPSGWRAAQSARDSIASSGDADAPGERRFGE